MMTSCYILCSAPNSTLNLCCGVIAFILAQREFIVEHSFLASTIKVVIADPAAKLWYADKLPTATELYFLRDFALKPGARVYDSGAHQAVIAAMLARVVGPEGSVLALEPDPFSHKIALRNKELNQLEQLEVLQAAGADTTTTIEFGLVLATSGRIPQTDYPLHRITVPAYSVDDLTKEHGVPDVLYLDVEGYEQHVLKGAGETLRRARPDCVVEVHIGLGLEDAGGSVAAILEFFPIDIYDIWIKNPDSKRRDELVPLADVGVENWNYHCNMVAGEKTS